MKTKIMRRLKLIGALMMVMMMTISIVGNVQQIVNAAGGNVKVTLANIEGLDPNTEFEFKVYKVGHFKGPDIELETELQGSNVDVKFPPGLEETDAERASRMLSSASQLAKYVDDNNISLDAIGGTHKLRPGNGFSQAVEENALYLVRANTVRVDNCNWSPQPVYVAILDGDSSITISNEVGVKVVMIPVQFKHRIKKTWVIPESAVDEKPSAIYVNIRYSGKVIDTIKLTSASSWTYDWTSEETGDQYKYIGHDSNGNEVIKTFSPDKSKPYWSADEILDSSQVTGFNLSDKEKAEIDRLRERFTPEYSGPNTVVVGTGTAGETVQLEEFVINNPYHEPPTPPNDNVKTGDDANPISWVAGMICACVLLAVVFFLRKRQKRD